MKVRLDNILILVVVSVLVFFFFSEKNGTYLSGSEAQVYLLLVATLISLFINLRFNNEFIEILNLVFVVFYIFRIPFLFNENAVSDVIARNVDRSEIPWDINILTFQYLSLVACLLVVNPRIPRINVNGETPSEESESFYKRIFQFAVFIILVNVAYTISFWEYGVSSSINILAILSKLFQFENALMLIIISSTVAGKEILSKYKFAIISSFLLALGYFLYIGNKSGLLQIMLWAYLARVAVHGPFVFRIRDVSVTLAVGIFSFVLYFIGSAFRAYHRTKTDSGHFFGTEEILNNALITFNGGISHLLDSFSYRMGYFDFFIDKVSNPAYKPFVNFSYYFKSLTDKLTPGFDVFDVPFLSRTLYSAYFGPSNAGTNSELITLFAESHLLLGFFSFLIYLPILFILKRATSGLKSSSEFVRGLYYMYIVTMFYSWVEGSGLDMLIAHIVYQGIFVFSAIYFITVITRKRFIPPLSG